MTLPNEVNIFELDLGKSINIQRIKGKFDDSQPIWLFCNQENVLLENTAYIFLNEGKSFRGKGVIHFLLKKIGESHYAYEMYRTSYKM